MRMKELWDIKQLWQPVVFLEVLDPLLTPEVTHYLIYLTFDFYNGNPSSLRILLWSWNELRILCQQLNSTSIAVDNWFDHKDQEDQKCVVALDTIAPQVIGLNNCLASWGAKTMKMFHNEQMEIFIVSQNILPSTTDDFSSQDLQLIFPMPL